MTQLREEDNETLFVGNLDPKVTEEYLYELFLQAGPIKSVTIPKDRSTKKSRLFGFICFKDEVSMPYAYYLFKDIALFGRPLKIQPRNKGYNIPPVHCVGVHSLEPKTEKNDESQEQFASYSPQQQLISNVEQSPNLDFSLNLAQTFCTPNNYYNNNNNVNRTPAIDTNTLNNFKDFFGNSPQQHFSPTFNNQFNNRRNSDAHDMNRSHSGGRFSGDNNHFGQRLQGRIEFPNNERNNDSPYNNRNSSPISNNNTPYQGHHNSYDRYSNSPRNNFNNSYNDGNCSSPNSPYYNRNFNNNRNNSPYNDRDHAHGSGKRNSWRNDNRRDFRRSRDGGGSSHHNHSNHDDRYQRRY